MEIEMVILKHLKTACFLAAASTILLATGCQSDTSIQAQETDASHSQAEVSETQRLENTQAAAGARADCTLYADHFDGGTLSSLGTNSLDMVLADTHSCNPLVIYLAVPEDSLSEDRRQAIGHYLEDRGGLKPEQIEFRAGPNPAAFHPVDTQLTAIPKTDTSTDGGSTYAASAAGGGK
jgi:hypothetical protein